MIRRPLLLLLAFSSFGCATLPSKPSETRQASPPTVAESARLERNAVGLAAQGDLVHARAELARLSEERRQAPPIRFLQACIALEAGELATVDTLLEGWKEPAPEVRLLQTLVTLRREQPALDGRSAFLRAWRAVGRPDLRNSTLLLPSWEESSSAEELGYEQAWSHARTDESRFLLALVQPETDHVRAALQHPPDRLPPEFLIVAADTFLKPGLPEDVRAQATRLLRERFTQLAAAHPESIQYPALALLLGTSLTAPFTPEELQRIDAFTQRSTWRQPDNLTLYHSALGSLEDTGMSPLLAQDQAFTLVVGMLAGPSQWTLYKRTEASLATLSSDELQRLGAALGRMGERIAAGDSLVEYLFGRNMMRRGAIMTGDIHRQEALAAQVREVAPLMNVMSRPAPYRWPLASLRRALFEATLQDEVVHLRDFEAADEPKP